MLVIIELGDEYNWYDCADAALRAFGGWAGDPNLGGGIIHENCFDYSALALLVSCPGLRRFAYGTHLTGEALERCLLEVEQPFHHLAELRATVEGDVVPQLVALVLSSLSPPWATLAVPDLCIAWNSERTYAFLAALLPLRHPVHRV
jgi:hypothetical protein